MTTFTGDTENECVIERHVHDIDPLRDLLRRRIGPRQCCLHDRYDWGPKQVNTFSV